MTVVAVLDLETTGLEPEAGDKIVEASVTWLEDNVRTSVTFLFNPGRPIPPEASAVHHLTDADVAEARPLPTAAEWVGLFASADYVVSHNAQFDRSFLPNLARPWICTWRVAMHLWPDAPGYGLQLLRYWRGLQPVLPAGVAPHRAEYDVACCVALLQEECDGRTLDALADLSNQPVLLKKVRFGKHRGELWGNLPRSYLNWLLSKDFDEDVKHTARHYL